MNTVANLPVDSEDFPFCEDVSIDIGSGARRILGGGIYRKTTTRSPVVAGAGGEGRNEGIVGLGIAEPLKLHGGDL